MRLLVSVRRAVEAARALEGGADIIDAKEPARGSLGAVDGPVLREIAEVLPGGTMLSVALGDAAAPDDVEPALGALGLGRLETAYLKIGFAGVGDGMRVREIIERLAEAAKSLPLRPRVIAVAYADHTQAGCPEPLTVAQLARAAGADGILLDTWVKDGSDLFARMSVTSLERWVVLGRELGLGTALAGSITEDTIATVLRIQPDIVGVRGAACEGGRSGQVSAARVRALSSALAVGRNATSRPDGTASSGSATP